MRQFRHRARHVIIRGHDDQRPEAALPHPAPRLGGIGDRVDRGAVEIDAAGDDPSRAPGASRAISRSLVDAVDAGNQEPVAAAAARSSIASSIREAPPVRTTIPSAFCGQRDFVSPAAGTRTTGSRAEGDGTKIAKRDQPAQRRACSRPGRACGLCARSRVVIRRTASVSSLADHSAKSGAGMTAARVKSRRWSG